MKNTIEYYYNFENVSLLKSGKETYIKHKNYLKNTENYNNNHKYISYCRTQKIYNSDFY